MHQESQHVGPVKTEITEVYLTDVVKLSLLGVFLEIQVLSYVSLAFMISLIFSYPIDYSLSVSIKKIQFQKYSNQS